MIFIKREPLPISLTTNWIEGVWELCTDGDPYTESLASAFIKAFRTLGGDVPLSLQVEKVTKT